MQDLNSDSPIQYIKGVGPRRAAALADLGVTTVGDLLEYYPFRYEVEYGHSWIGDLVPNTHATVSGDITRVIGRVPNMQCHVSDGTGVCVLRWFNYPFRQPTLRRGLTIVASGHVEAGHDRPEIVQPRVKVFQPNSAPAAGDTDPRKVGVYHANARIKSAAIRAAILNLVAHPDLPIAETVPKKLLRKHKLPTRAGAIRHMHAPESDETLDLSRRRLAYEEFLIMELALALRRRKRLSLRSGQKLPVTAEINERIRARFPFTLTKSQDHALREIARDLQSGHPMTRLLQGDVGSGKTVVALYACLVAIAAGRQAAIMAPTEILAQQHFANIEKYLAGSRVRHVLLRGKLAKKTRSEHLAAIERREIDLVVGTQALIQKDVAFDQLALVVVDEQHKFGVLQRHEFRTKGPMPHYLVMTATPIPRTLAMTVFGDLDVSVIKHSPPGRGKIITKVTTSRQWPTVMEYVRKRLEADEQAYVVCPQIGKDDDAEEAKAEGLTPIMAGAKRQTLMTVKETYEKLTEGPWRGLKVGLLHGSLKPADKQAIIEAFAGGDLHAVVSTTVVEVGVDVANATIMVIENADRYGLSQLHQLRGRVGRGHKDSLCVLIARSRGAKAADRLEVMTQTTDGFKIAEADLRQRGPGQLFGTKQHGLPELRIASIVDDFSLLEDARQDAFDIVAEDPDLRDPEHQVLLPALKKMFGDKLKLIDAG